MSGHRGPNPASGRPDAPRALFVVAASGLGHFRRTVAVLAELLRGADRAPRLAIVSEPWQRRRMAGWTPLDELEASGPAWIDGVTSPGVGVGSPDELVDGRLVDWERRLRERVDLAGFDLVVSDNLSGVLHDRPDAALMGSFLWSDVLEPAAAGRPAVREFVDRERAVLDAVRPPMICVADMAMAGVRTRTTPVEVGWMCEPMAPATPGATRVAVLGGRTGAADHLLADVAAALAGAGFDLVVDAAFSAAAPGAPTFDYHDHSWSELGLVVGRPGIGTLTECVGRRLPVASVHEPGNRELEHNGRRVEALGIGRNLGADHPAERVADCVAAMLTERSETMRKAFEQLNTSGLTDAAAWLADRLGVTFTRGER